MPTIAYYLRNYWVKIIYKFTKKSNSEICQNFAQTFNNNVQKIIHKGSINTIDYTETICQTQYTSHHPMKRKYLTF